jgi:PQQ-dependent dehydrogenase (s-GDH family)
MRALLALLLLTGCTRIVAPVREPRFAMRVVAEGLSAPWEVFVGPDGWLWISEHNSMRITRVLPKTGAREVLLTLDDDASDGGQVFGAAYDEGTLFVVHASSKQTKIISFDYASGQLGARRELITGLAPAGDHASGRLQIGPDHRVYYTIGDQGANQYANRCKPNRAQRLPTADEVARQDWSSYEGKLLRLERDGAIPADNPVLNGVRSHVYSYGHRNVQGLAFDDRGRLFASEHGPKTDDEINEIHAGKNYGWPHVAGFQDDRAYEYANWSGAPNCAALAWDDYAPPPEVPRQPESAWSHPDFTPPIKTLYTVDTGFAYDAGDCLQRAPSCWPTIAPSSLAFYGGSAAWGRALLVPSLKEGSVFVLRFSEDGTLRDEPPRAFLETKNRYRDLAVGPDGRTIYVITDDVGFTSGPTQNSRQQLTHRGALLEFKLID